ncbi:MAG: acetyl-CoA carboxylase carboxyltransferase subunit alpha [Acidobacteriota bacterium]|nr:MAG: acetyl-CoA carboxylase carboxyltransferase subunit alpha [Acidobacteriota bacterium]
MMQDTDQELQELRRLVEQLPRESADEISELQQKIRDLEESLKARVTAWDRVQLSRHESRPYTLDYVSRIFSGFREIHGDRRYADDKAIVGGMAYLDEQPVMLIGHQKGRNTKQRLYRNYGMPRPEGYRKAMRLMYMAEKFNRPVICFIDTPGAYPGIGAEKRGQAQAIAENLRSMSQIQVPIVVVVLGEGGSGGALAIGVGDRVLMLENSIYSVISPESCSAILWKDQEHAREAADALKLTAEHLHRLGVVDEVVKEPSGGAQDNWDEAAALLKNALIENLNHLADLSPEELLEHRYQRFRRIGEYLGNS